MLTEEQRDALKKVGEATGVDLLGLIEKQGKGATEFLESRGVQFKSKQPGQPQSFGQQFKGFVKAHRPRQRYKLALVEADEPTRNTKLEGKLQASLQAASVGHTPDLRPMSKMLHKARKDAEGELSPENEALARRVYEEMTELRAMIAKVGELVAEQEAIQERLAELSPRLDAIDGGGQKARNVGLPIGPEFLGLRAGMPIGDPAVLRGNGEDKSNKRYAWTGLLDNLMTRRQT